MYQICLDDMDLDPESKALPHERGLHKRTTFPMVISINPSAGDMDLDPSTGQYRMSAVVPVVEVNELRATLGVRPLPNPVAGALRGTLHLNGPLEEPLFSGAPHNFELVWMGAPEQACGSACCLVAAVAY